MIHKLSVDNTNDAYVYLSQSGLICFEGRLYELRHAQHFQGYFSEGVLYISVTEPVLNYLKGLPKHLRDNWTIVLQQPNPVGPSRDVAPNIRHTASMGSFCIQKGLNSSKYQMQMTHMPALRRIQRWWRRTVERR